MWSWQKWREERSHHISAGRQSKFPLIMHVLRTTLLMSFGAMVNGVQSAGFSAQKASGLAPCRGPGAGGVIGCGLSMGCACLVMLSSATGLITRRLGAYLAGLKTISTRP